MDQVKLTPMARKQLERAARTLQSEMRRFAAKRTMDPVLELEKSKRKVDPDWKWGWEDDPERGSQWNTLKDQYKQEPDQWAESGSWETFTDSWETFEEQIREEMDDKIRPRMDEDELLRQTVGLLADGFNEAFEKAARQAVHPLAILTDQANLLRVFTEMWTVYQTAWEQRYATDFPVSEAIWLGDRIIRSFYDVVKKLDLALPGQKLIVVPHQSRMYASGFDLPMLYIVAPRFGSEQIWIWLSYAHEVGHHVYRNVKGLSDELTVNVMMTLGSLGKDQTTQGIWFRWLEEIFADLFGLLQIGRAFANSQQRMLLYLPPRVIGQLSTDDDFREGLLRAPDDTHPPPHLRAHLAIEALRIIKTLGSEEELQKLEKRWDDFFREGPDVDTTNLYLPVQGEYQKSSRQEMNAGDADDDTNDTVAGECYQKFHCQEMKDIGKTVLEVMLTTKLYALGMKLKSDEPDPPLTSDEPDLPSKRSLIDVFRSPLDEEEVGQAQESINQAASSEVRVAAEAIRIPEVGVAAETIRIPDFQHLLTAAQDKLEELTTNLTADEEHVVHESRLITTREGDVVHASKLIPVDKAIEELSDSVFSVLAKRARLEKNG
jgi:hypothetical protein